MSLRLARKLVVMMLCASCFSYVIASEAEDFDFRASYPGYMTEVWLEKTTFELLRPKVIYFTSEGESRLLWLEEVARKASATDPDDPRPWFLLGRLLEKRFSSAASKVEVEFDRKNADGNIPIEVRRKLWTQALTDAGAEQVRLDGIAAYQKALDLDDAAPKEKQLLGLMCAQIAMSGSSSADMQVRALRKEMARPYDTEEGPSYPEGDDSASIGYRRIINAYLDEHRYADAAKVVEEMMAKYPGRLAELTASRDDYLKQAAESAAKAPEAKDAGVTTSPVVNSAPGSDGHSVEDPATSERVAHWLNRFWPAVATLGGVLVLLLGGFVVRRRARSSDH